MSVYRCDICENYFDSDYHGCEENANDETSCICENCHMEVTGENHT